MILYGFHMSLYEFHTILYEFHMILYRFHEMCYGLHIILYEFHLILYECHVIIYGFHMVYHHFRTVHHLQVSRILSKKSKGIISKSRHDSTRQLRANYAPFCIFILKCPEILSSAFPPLSYRCLCLFWCNTA